jgi:hypothetical protein
MEVSNEYKTLWQRYWMCDNLAYNSEPGDTEVPYNIYFKHLQHFILINVFTIVNEVFIILQLVPPLCDYKVWIDTVRGLKAISYVYLMARINMMGEELCARRIEERRHAVYFTMRCEMDHEQEKEKREEERA